MKVAFTRDRRSGVLPNSAVAFFQAEGVELGQNAREIEQLTGTSISRAMERSRFKAHAGQILDIIAPADCAVDRIILVGTGAQPALTMTSIEDAAANAYSAVKTSGANVLELRPDDFNSTQAAHVAFGALLAAYRFAKYRTQEKEEAKPTIECIRVVADDPEEAERNFRPLSGLADSIYLARDLVSEPANVLYPAEFARRIKELETLGLEVEILGEEQLQELGMRTLLGVGQGSARESQLAVMRWTGAEAQDPIAFVGKGVCFDTGGITLKAGTGMESMIWDMAGAAAVTGLMRVLAARKAKVHAVGIVGLVENMPDGNAQRPGDIVASMSGQTIEIISTDAEGRLVLADALWYCQDRFKPRLMIDLATLTGASKVALGTEYAALFSNSDWLAEQLLAASDLEGEGLWRLPLSEKHEKTIESSAADMKNHHDSSGGAITGALFLQKFVNKCPWAHIDMTPTAWLKPSTRATVPEGASGFGVRLLNRFVSNYCER